MSQDIVARLNEQANHVRLGIACRTDVSTASGYLAEVAHEAAALITTLRAERDALKDEVEQIRGEASGAHQADSRAFLSANARAEAAEALVQSMREAVEQAFKDGLAYGNNVADADPEIAWQQSRVRLSLGAKP